MGAFATHIIFGGEVLKYEKEAEWKNILVKYKGLYKIGCQGPDLFLYNPLLHFGTQKNIGTRMHTEKTGLYFAYLLQTIWEQNRKENREMGIAYFMGALSHYTLDSILHPYVYSRVGYDPKDSKKKKGTTGLHFRLEAGIDAKLLEKKLSCMPSAYKPWEEIKITRQEKKVLCEILAKAVNRTYQTRMGTQEAEMSITMMKTAIRSFFGKKDSYRKYLLHWEKILWKEGFYSNLLVTDGYVNCKGIMNTDHEKWIHPWDKGICSRESVWDLYEKAVKQYASYEKILEPLLKTYLTWGSTKEENTRKYYEKVIHGQIIQGIKKLGNRSYHSGMPLKEV